MPPVSATSSPLTPSPHCSAYGSRSVGVSAAGFGNSPTPITPASSRPRRPSKRRPGILCLHRDGLHRILAFERTPKNLARVGWTPVVTDHPHEIAAVGEVQGDPVVFAEAEYRLAVTPPNLPV